MGVVSDIEEMIHCGKQMKNANRCGLDKRLQTPFLHIENFQGDYEAKIEKGKVFDTKFNLDEAIQESCRVVGRFPQA
ncbi:MAG: hypothetical protein R2750_00925 [Bacteroidales bacterium]